MSMLFSSIYQLLIEYHKSIFKCSSLQLLFYQAPISGVLIFFVVPFFETMPNLSRLCTIEISCTLVASGILAFIFNFSLFWIISNISSVSYNFIAHARRPIVIVIGFLLFGEPCNLRQILGLFLSILGIVHFFIIDVLGKSHKFIIF